MLKNSLPLFLEQVEFLWAEFSSYHILLKASLSASLVAITGSVITYSSILAARWKGDRREKLAEKYAPKIQKALVEYIVLNPELNSSPIEQIELPVQYFKKLSGKSEKVRSLLIESLIHYRANFSGRVNNLLGKLYRDLNFQKHALQKLNSRKTETVILALNELLSMGIQIDKKTLTKLLHHENIFIRNKARCHMIMLSKDNPLQFMDEITEPISMWEEIELFNKIVKNVQIDIPDFSKWIRPDVEPTVVMLCLKLIVHFQQFESIQAIVSLLNCPDTKLRRRLINALGKLTQTDAEAPLIAIYDGQPKDCKLEILKALGRICSGNSMDFLLDKFRNESSITLRKHAAKSIVKNYAYSEKLLEPLLNKLSGPDLSILRHAKNPLIKY